MKKLIQLGAIFFGLLITFNAYSQNYSSQPSGYRAGNYSQSYGANNYNQSYGAANCCPQDTACCEQTQDCECGDKWVLMCHQQPCYYNDWCCVEEKVPCTRTCTRYVPKYCEVDRCRYVPQHYKETLCRYEKECYQVEDCRTCKKWVCNQKCKMVPRYYWKHICDNSQQVCKPACCE